MVPKGSTLFFLAVLLCGQLPGQHAVRAGEKTALVKEAVVDALGAIENDDDTVKEVLLDGQEGPKNVGADSAGAIEHDGDTAKEVMLEGLPLPPIETATQQSDAEAFEKKLAEKFDNKVPILLTGSNDMSQFFTPRKKALLRRIFVKMSKNKLLRRNAVLVGSSAHGRAPGMGSFYCEPSDAQCKPSPRGILWDNVVQERGAMVSKALGGPDVRMFQFADQASGNWDVVGMKEMNIKKSNEDGNRMLESFKGSKKFKVVTIRTPDRTPRVPRGSNFPKAEPDEWQGVKSYPQVAMCFGGGPRASQLATKRAGKTDKTMQVLTDPLTEENFPYKENTIFVFGAGGMGAGSILKAPQPLDFKPSAVELATWEALTNTAAIDFFNKETVVADFADEAVAAPGDQETIDDYAQVVVDALSQVVLPLISR